MSKKFFIAVFLFLITCLNSNAQKVAYTMPEVNKILKAIHIYIDVELDETVKKDAGFNNTKYLLPLVNYIDYNIIGKGGIASIDEDKLRNFIVDKIKEGKKMDAISNLLVGEYSKQKKIKGSSVEKEDVFHLGGYFVTQVELQEEEKGKLKPKIELNQLKLYFASHINSASVANRVNVFAEFNPLPEEVIHQVNEAVITKGPFTDTLRELEITGGTDEKVPFERLFINIANVANTNINITLGQFRNPFGFWSDYSTHRNFTNTKNNTLVTGYGLKKIETGIKLDYQFNNNWDIEAAVVYGRMGRTSPIYRDDEDDKKDFVTHITYSNNKFSAGASAYLAEFSLKKQNAYGIDLGYRTNKLFLSAEVVTQQNKQPGHVAPNIALFTNTLSSTAAYLQFDYSFTDNLHLYGLYDYWQLKADAAIVNKPTFKAYHGLRYSINTKARWTILEYGYIMHNAFDKNFSHFSSHLEINF